MNIEVVNGLGVEGRSVQFGDPNKRVLDPRATFKSSVEYDFYLFSPGWVTIHTYALPVFPLNLLEGDNYSYIIDNNVLIRPDISAGEYSDEWKENVLRNCAITSYRYFIPAAGKHTLKLMCGTQGLVIQKIVIDTGGLKESYTGPGSTEL